MRDSTILHAISSKIFNSWEPNVKHASFVQFAPN